ncbi:MAG: protein kinase [Bacteroidetes bacterium]|nr:protein kinase [Bacteroidota bacterium]
MIRELIQEGKLEEAIDALSKLYGSLGADMNTLDLLRSRLSEVKETNVKGIGKPEDSALEMNRITDSFLYFFENLEERVNTVLGLKYDVRDFDKQVRLKMMRQFEVTEQLGNGSSAVIYRARELSSGKTVAIRALKDIKPLSDKLTTTAYHIKHRNIIEILSSYESDLPFCIVLEYINGITLDKLLDIGYFPVRDSVAIIQQLCDAVYYLQNIDIDHKYLRPSKIIIDHELKPVISVFEIFKDMRAYSRLDKIREDLMYISPEELRKQEPDIDYDRVNQFLLGLLLYEMLTGRPLFEGKNLLEVQRGREQFFFKPTHRRKVLKSLGIPEGLRAILQKLLEFEPENRFPNLIQLEKQLQRLPIESDPVVDAVHESYMRCCAKNKEFISHFYQRLFKNYPDKNYAAKFPDNMAGNKTRKKLRMIILQLIDAQNPFAPVPISNIKQFGGHASLAPDDYHNFLTTLKAEVQANDFLWKKDVTIGQAWDELIAKAMESLK